MEEGAIVHIEYELYNSEEKLIETNLEATAKEHDMHEDGRDYSPLVALIGGGTLIEGFEDHLLEAEADTDYEIDISCKKAYGEKNSELIEVLSQDKVMQQIRDPNSLQVNGPITLGGKTGTLTLWAAGRARIDFNHPMAGQDLRYKYKITKVIDDKGEKVAALLKANTGHDDFGVEFDGDDVAITIPESMLFDTNAAMMKFRMVSVLRDSVNAGKVSFVEVHEERTTDPGHGEEGHVHDENCDHGEEE